MDVQQASGEGASGQCGPPPVGMSTKQSFLEMVALMASSWLGRKSEFPK